MLLPSFSLRRSRLQIKVVKRGREENLWVDMRLLPVQWRTFRCATVPTPHLCSQYHRCRNASPFALRCAGASCGDGAFRRSCCIIVLGVPLHSWRCRVNRISFRDCPYCGSSEVYRSHGKTWGDFAARFFFLDPARCHYCMRRHFRPIFLRARSYVTVTTKKPVQTRANDDKRKRSA
jgi:hypothetical protein